MTRYSPAQFAAIRVALGAYGAICAARLLPYGGELFADGGLVATQGHGFVLFRNVFPNILDHWTSELGVQAFLLLQVVAGLALVAGVGRRVAALVLWYGFACIVHRNPSVMNPATAFMGWLCLATTLVPLGEGFSVFQRQVSPGWRLPRGTWQGAWIIMALGYSVSGYAKLSSPAWVDGRALELIVQMPHAAENLFADLARALPSWLMRALTWFVLASEVGFAPLCLHRVGRLVAWGSMTAMHVALLFVMDFREISVGMLLVHAFTFDRGWLEMVRPSARAGRDDQA